MNDHSVTGEIEQKLRLAVKKLHELAPALGAARQVREFSSDQRKNALAQEQMQFIKRGESVAGSEALARSSPVYLLKIKELGEAYAEAEAIIASFAAWMAAYEANRSLLAMTRETLKTLEG